MESKEQTRSDYENLTKTLRTKRKFKKGVKKIFEF